LRQINLKKSHQKMHKSKIKKKALVKCLEWSTLGHFSSECPNKKSDQAKLSRRQRRSSLEDKIVDCPKDETSKQVYQNWMIRFGKPECPILAENSRTFGQYNKGFKMTLERYMSKNESTKKQSKGKASRIKYQICYTCRDKGHLSKDCPKTQTLIHKVVNNDISHVEPKNDTSTIKMISSPCDSSHAI
jgi:hypothetical protein